MNFNKYELKIPHKGKMLLIDGIENIDFENKTINVSAKINEENIFYEIGDNGEGGIPSYILTEYAAQSAAAYNAYNSKEGGAKIGFLLNIKKAVCYADKVKGNETVRIKVKETLRDSNVAYYDGEVFSSGGEIIMNCSIMVMEKRD